ncbi:hypothetical protein ZWY2020_008364 [Hordeum vulgare]|nr:hypothetical protein ZWY2020_008364 [Hordeum vulgare]
MMAILFPRRVQLRDSCSSKVLQKVIRLSMWIVTQWRSRLMKLPRSVPSWWTSPIKRSSHTLASHRCYRNQLFDQLIRARI